MEPVGFGQHDHSSCIAEALAAAEAACLEGGLQLTPVRRRVLEILLERHVALGAYEILDVLRAEGLGSQPPVVYRALDFLVKNRFAHRIERLNAFVACAHPGERHAPVFLICSSCDSVAEAEADSLAGQLSKTAQEAGFEIEKAVVEAVGLCPRCKDDVPA